MHKGIAVAAAVVAGFAAIGCAATPPPVEPGPRGQPSASSPVVGQVTPPSQINPSRLPAGSPMMNPSPTAPAHPSSSSGDADAAVRAAKQLFAETEQVDVSAIRVVSTDAVTWPDGSLGCPQPGQMYVQVLTDGYRVVLDAGGKQLTFHTGRGNPPAVVRCDRAAPGESGRSDR